jgi:hypothetical protein
MHALRYWMTLAEGKVVYRDHEFVVIQNPSNREYNHLEAQADHGEGLRAILSLGDLYVWNGYFANHDEIARKLGVAPDAELHLWGAYVELDMIGVAGGSNGDDDDDEEMELAKELAATLRGNPIIQRIYGVANVDVKADFGDWVKWL